jgi:flavin reductase (DIM6/NTAB) family NADH-FMN oxidoreductase RutF
MSGIAEVTLLQNHAELRMATTHAHPLTSLKDLSSRLRLMSAVALPSASRCSLCVNGSVGINRSRAPAAARHRCHRQAAAAARQTGGDAAIDSAAQQQQQPPPYAQLSMPVYSLATVDPSGSSPTMNLVTYAAPISLEPRHFALGLFVGTLSWQNMLATRSGVLQVLGEQHAALFDLLGRTSGRDVDKLRELAARGAQVTRRTADGVPLLVRACCKLHVASVCSAGGGKRAYRQAQLTTFQTTDAPAVRRN